MGWFIYPWGGFVDRCQCYEDALAVRCASEVLFIIITIVLVFAVVLTQLSCMLVGFHSYGWVDLLTCSIHAQLLCQGWVE